MTSSSRNQLEIYIAHSVRLLSDNVREIASQFPRIFSKLDLELVLFFKTEMGTFYSDLIFIFAERIKYFAC